MKHRLVQLLSLPLCIVLLVGVIFTPTVAGRVFRSAYADSPSEHTLYWADFKADVLSKAASDPNTSRFISIFNEIESHWNSSTWNVFVMYDPNGNFCLASYVRNGGDGFYGMRYGSNEYRMLYNTSNYNSTFKLENYFVYYNGSFRISGEVSTNISATSRTSILNLATVTNTAVLYPTPYEFNASGWECYSLHGMNQGNTNGYGMISNISEGSAPPIIYEYEIKTFYLGGSQYITVSDQRLIRGMDEELYGYLFDIGVCKGTGDDLVTEFFDFNFSSVIHIQYPGFDYSDFDNLSPLGGIEAINIDGIVALGYNEIFYSHFAEFIDDDWYVAAECTNLPYMIQVNEAETEYLDQLQDFVNKLNSFLDQQEDFNNNYVIPDTNLPGYVKNLLGDNAVDAHTFEVVNDGSDVGLVIATNEISYTWLPKQFIVMDVDCFFEFSPEGVDTTYNPFLTLNPEYYNQFDAVIVLSHADFLSVKQYTDSLGSTHIDTDFLSNCIYFRWEDATVPLVWHEASWFGSYLSEEPDYQYNTVSGMTLFTNHYLLHVQNMILSDGISSVCDWLDSYGVSTGDYQKAVLEGISAANAAVSTVDGHLSVFFTDSRSFFASVLKSLDMIYDKLRSIDVKLDQLVENTSEGNPDPWYLSLWNFILNFKPSDSDFSASLEQYDNNWEEFPELPAPSTVPLLPTIGG